MKIKDVMKLTPEERFFYWCRERHSIYIKRVEKQKPAPWTDDEVLQTNFFTNPYRENDKVTVWFRQNIRDPMDNTPDVLMATVIFRWFNRIETGQLLIDHNLLKRWDSKKATDLLEQYRDSGHKVFTGAYMIKAGNGAAGCKVGNVCQAIDNVRKLRFTLLSICDKANSMQEVWRKLTKFPHLGGFMSYEIVCDLRYTYLLKDAHDINTWANPGPGAIRGIARLHGMKVDRKVEARHLPVSALGAMQKLLEKSYAKLQGMPVFEMREIEHSLCEYDKYERALRGDGKMKRKYNATGR